MLRSIAFYQILGISLVFLLGTLALLLFVFVGLIGYLNKKGITKIPFKWHPRLAKTAIIVAIFHAILAFAAFS